LKINKQSIQRKTVSNMSKLDEKYKLCTSSKYATFQNFGFSIKNSPYSVMTRKMSILSPKSIKIG
jgi:hypothetical protein